MSTIAGLEKLNGQLNEEQIESLNRAAQRHKKESNIAFSIRYADDQIIEIESRQDENRSGKYATEVTLIKRAQELFGKVLSGFELVILPFTYLPSPATAVTPAWLEQKMQQKGLRIKQMAFDTGIDRESISDWVTGKRRMSQIVKAMFYFYLVN
jgi:hypothetical protein